MTERRVRAATVVLALLGAAVASYLLVVSETGSAPLCATSGCETVARSVYAEVLGVPVAALGLLGYAFVAGAALARGEVARMAQATIALSALVFSAYLLVVQLHLIGAVCQWCVVSDVLTTGIAAAALLRIRIAAAP